MSDTKITNKEEAYQNALKSLKKKGEKITWVLLAKEMNISRQRFFIIYNDIIKQERGLKKQKVLDEFSKTLKANNITLISTSYETLQSKLELKCDNPEHPNYFVSATAIRNGYFKCPCCPQVKKGRPSKYTLKDAQDLAIKKGGVCLSTEYINNEKKLKWHCGNEFHAPWEATFSNVKYMKSWCPQCWRVE